MLFISFIMARPSALNKLANSEKAMLKISRDKCNNKIISKDSLKAYFKEICEKYRITTIDEIENIFPNAFWNLGIEYVI